MIPGESASKQFFILPINANNSTFNTGEIGIQVANEVIVAGVGRVHGRVRDFYLAVLTTRAPAMFFVVVLVLESVNIYLICYCHVVIYRFIITFIIIKFINTFIIIKFINTLIIIVVVVILQVFMHKSN